jgi:hypothetical protein
MTENTPTLEEWRRLYDAAIRVKGIAPWEWMTETDVPQLPPWLFPLVPGRTGGPLPGGCAGASAGRDAPIPG